MQTSTKKLFSLSRLKKAISFATCGAVLMVASQSAMAGGSTSIAEIKKAGVLKLATEDNYAPFEMIKGGEPTGFDHDVIAELKKYAKDDFKVTTEILPWTGLLSAVLAGKYDMALTGSIVSPERLDVFNFVAPFASAQHYAILRADEDKIKEVKDLCGKTVGLQAGSILLTRLPELEKKLEAYNCKVGEVVQYTSYPEAYADLANGRLDYVINSFVPAKVLTTERSKIFKMGMPVSGAGFHAWPIPKANKELLDYMTKFMEQLRESGKLAELQKKWFGQEIKGLPTTPLTSKEQFLELTK